MKQLFVCAIILISFYNAGFAQSPSALQAALNQFDYKTAITLLKAEPTTLNNLLLQATCYQKLAEYDQALNIYTQIPKDSLTANMTIDAALCASQNGAYATSIEYWNHAENLLPNNQYILRQKVFTYFKQKDYNNTIAEGKRILTVDSVPSIVRTMADVYLNMGATDTAITYYRRAIDLNPKDDKSVYRLAQIHLSTKSYLYAYQITHKYLTEQDSTNTNIGQINGITLYSMHKYEEATDRLLHNIALNDTSYSTCYYLGMSLYAQKKIFEASKWLGKAYSINPSDINLIYYYGSTLAQTYHHKECLEVLDEGIKIMNQMQEMRFDFMRTYAESYRRIGKYNDAVTYLKQAYDLQPSTDKLLYHIAYCYDMSEQYEHASTYYERFLKTAKKPMSYYMDEKEDNTEEYLYRLAASRLDQLKEELFFKKGNSKQQ